MPTVKELRLERKLSQAELAALSGVSTPVISNLENGHLVQSTTFILVCRALGVSREDVTGVNVYRAANRRRKRQ